MSTPVPLVAIARDDLEALLRKLIREELSNIHEVVGADSELLSPKQAAKMVRISAQSVYDAIHDQSLPAMRKGKAWQVERGQVKAWHQRRFAQAD
ncbi:MAG: DNA-binding protein [Planctomycetota bacterium]|nr:MAG: DNA-binding protein [Planctomycetota bacterium]